MHLCAGRAEHDPAVLADLEAGPLEPICERASPVLETEHTALEPALRGDESEILAVEAPVAIRELKGGAGAHRVEACRAAGIDPVAITNRRARTSISPTTIVLRSKNFAWPHMTRTPRPVKRCAESAGATAAMMPRT